MRYARLALDADRIADVTAETAELIGFLGLAGIERAEAASLSYGGQRLLDMGLALATRPRILLLDEPLAGLAAAERERIAALIKSRLAPKSRSCWSSTTSTACSRSPTTSP